MTTSLLSPEQLSQQIRVRLAQERLPGADGVYKTHRGTGRLHHMPSSDRGDRRGI